MSADLWAYTQDEDYRDIPFFSLGPADTESGTPPPGSHAGTALHFAVSTGDIGMVQRLLKNQQQASMAVHSLMSTDAGVFAANVDLPEFLPCTADDPEGIVASATLSRKEHSPQMRRGYRAQALVRKVASFLHRQPLKMLHSITHGYTALHLAVLFNEVECCRVILEHLHKQGVVHAFINQTAGRLRKTPLMYAAGVVSGHHKGNRSCVPLLLKHGADPSSMDSNNRRALEHALRAQDAVQDKVFGGDALRANATNTVTCLMTAMHSVRPPQRKRINQRKTPP
jgi:hypothetical protein